MSETTNENGLMAPMSELTIRPEEIRDALERFVASYTPDVASREEVGRVTVAG